MMTDSNNSQSTPPPERSRIAEIIAGVSIGGITIMSGLAIYLDRTQTMHVFGVVLPLLGSWMGTVLAFYFSRDNLAAATQSVKDLTQAITSQDKLKATLIKDKMIPVAQIDCINSDKDNTKLSDLLKIDRERLPVFSTNKVIRYLIYKAMINKYLTKFVDPAVKPPGDKAAADLTVADLVANSDDKKLFTDSFGFVRVDGTLADAKAVMDKIEKCADVFVTTNGTKDEAVVGWITDDTIIQNSKI